MVKYDYEVTETSTYAHALRLVEAHAAGTGTVLDLGCGVAPLAGPLTDAGWAYRGLELDEELVAVATDRDADVTRGDLTIDDDVRDAVERAGDELRVVLLLDVLEHLLDPHRLLRTLREAVSEDVLLVTSIPNGTHTDIARSILRGQFDYSDAGLLDRTHVHLYSRTTATALLADTGWREIAEHDKHVWRSEEHLPGSPFATGTLLGDHLATVAGRVRDGAPATYQFVRAHLPGEAPQEMPEENDPSAPALSVLVRTMGGRPALLEETLLSLAGQETDDLEVLLLVHTEDDDVVADVRAAVDRYPASFAERVHVHQVIGGGQYRPLNVGLRVARGKHVVILDDDDVVLAHWASTYIEAQQRYPGRVLRAVVADQQANRTPDGRSPYLLLSGHEVDPNRFTFSWADHLVGNRTPPCGFAVPRGVHTELGIEFDEDCDVLEDFDFLMRTASVVGVSDTQEVTSLYRRWAGDDATYNATPRAVWEETRARVVANLGATPVLVAPGEPTTIRALATRRTQEQQQADYLRRSRDEWKERAEELQDEARRARDEVHGLRDDADHLRESRREWRERAEELLAEVDELQEARRSWKARAEELLASTYDDRSRADRAERKLGAIESSRAWRVVQGYWRVMNRLRGRR